MKTTSVLTAGSIGTILSLAAICCLAGGALAASGNYLQFDGNDVAVIPNSASLTPTSALTLEMWLNWNTWPVAVEQFPINKGNDRASGTYRLAVNSDGRVGFYIGDLGGLPSANVYINPAPLTWHHLAGTYDGADYRLYFDGELKATSHIGSVSMASSYPVYLSYNAISGYEYYFSGKMDDVAIWGTARTQAEIQSDMAGGITGNEAGLAAYWNFEEPLSSQVIVDRSPNHNDGQLGFSAEVDSVDPTRIPEPATLSLLALGSLAMLRRARRR